jgi:outer membrane protein assembly factor BamB
MRYRHLASICWILACVYGLVAQGDVGLLRGNVGRTGEFGVPSVGVFAKSLWQSPKMYGAKQGERSHELEISVLGLKYEADAVDMFARSFINPAWWPGSDYSSYFPETGRESMPLLYDDSVFLSFNFEEGFVVSLDAKTGKVNWFYRCAKCYVSSLAIYKNLEFVSSRESHWKRGKIRALNIADGKEEWSYGMGELGMPLSAPTIDRGVLYFTTHSSRNKAFSDNSNSSLHALDIVTRTIKWSFDAKGVFDPPAILDGLLFAGSKKDYLYAIDVGTGAEKWKFKAAARFPVARNGAVYFADGDSLLAVDATSGLLKWRQKDSGGVDTAMTVSVTTIYYGGINRFYAVEVGTGKFDGR